MPNVSYKSKQMIVMRRDLKMRKGKIAAQAGHACVEATLMALAREGRLDQIRATQDWVYVDHAEQDRSPSPTGLTPAWPRSASMWTARRRFWTLPRAVARRALPWRSSATRA